ncbi:MAG: geranylgeranyl reductase [uncultured Thermomicrobiales bacterium]|uniref:Geranylgeranyl reductase n=1 Tax=uncultured Thermomicrobiales bacterium TaxID=1645740 RepID=A0A6J4UCU8_9BACT|nr:MAG: geranylgeranyl reductase [uncultured Thermomicrobiales bacterium]
MILPASPIETDSTRGSVRPVPGGTGPAVPAAVEVIVVGGGPAGSATAALLADLGHEVLILDKARFPRHKACSEYVNPGGVAVLERLGVMSEIDALGAHRMAAMRVHAPGGRSYLADYDGVETGRTALGLSRYRLDHLLLRRAMAAGATVAEGAHVRGLVVDGGVVRGVEVTVGGTRQTIRARLVIGADGRHSVVTRSLGIDATVPWLAQTGLVAHYRDVSGLDRFGEMHVGRGGYGGLAPLEDGLTNVAFVSPADRVAGRTGGMRDYFDAGIASLPGMAERLRGGRIEGTVRGVGPMAHRATRVAGDGYLLVGDAAYFLDPFTGEGIYAALRAAELAAPVASAALRRGEVTASSLAPYRAARRRVFTAKGAVCWIVQGFIHQPPLMDYVTRRLDERAPLGRQLASVLGNIGPAAPALSPVFLARLLRP